MDNNVLEEIDRKIILYKKTRDSEYFNKAVELVYPYLRSYAEKIVKEDMLKQYIDDIVSDTYVKMHDKTLEYYTHYSRAYYFDWCCSLLRSVKVDYIKSISNITFVEYTEDSCVINENEYQYSHKTDMMDDDVEYKKYLHTILHDALQSLTDIKRKVIEEIYMNRKSYKETSDSLNMKMDVLKYHVYTAKNDLKKEITQKHPDL